MDMNGSYRGSQLKAGSNLRNGPLGHQPPQDYNISEEELYERRRQQELRRQIQMKEQELEQLSSNKERLGQRFGIHTWTNKVEETGSKGTRFDKTPPQRLGAGSPLRKKSNSRSPGRVGSVGSSGRHKSGGRSGSPLRQKSGSPVRPYLPQTISSSQNDYLIQLQNDNSSLQRRLNLVLQELDRVNRDRNNLSQKFKNAEMEASRLRKMLSDEDLDDGANRNLQIELNNVKDQNKDQKLKIADIDRRRADVMSQLRVLQGERERFMSNNEEMSKDFQRKMGMAQALEQELFHGHNRIQKIIDQIESLTRQNASDAQHSHDVQRVLDRLRMERDDLLRKLSQLNRTYDNCVTEITRERQQMHLHNKHHSKLLVAKGMFAMLEVMQLARKQDALNEFFTYCRFDQKCHTTLKTFVDVLERLGQYKMRVAIQQWHQKTFKPIENLNQQDALVRKLRDSKLLTKMWNLWRNRYLQTQSVYGHKNKAVQAIWEAKCKDVRKEMQRAFTIWREKANFAELRERKFKFMVWRAHSNRMRQAFHLWMRHQQEQDDLVRLHVLSATYAQEQLKLITVNQLQTRTQEVKRRRLNILRSYYKAWRESNQYRRYMIAQNVSVSHFRKQCNTSLLKACFDALRHSKENEKHLLMMSALQDETMPAIASLTSQIAKHEENETRTVQTRAINTMQKMIRAQLSSYLQKWKWLTNDKQQKLFTHMKQMIIRAYKTRLSTAFATMKKGKGHKMITHQQGNVTDSLEQQAKLQSEVIGLNREIQEAARSESRSGQTALNRSLGICIRRYLQQGMKKWSENVKFQQAKEECVCSLLLRKMRLRMLREAFNHYRAETDKITQQVKNQSRVNEMVISKYHLRRKRAIFNAWAAYRITFQKATYGLGALSRKMRLWLMARGFKKWANQGHMKHEQKLQGIISLETERLGTHMQNEKKAMLNHESHKSDNHDLKSDLMRHAERLMHTKFARLYYSRLHHRLAKWKLVVQQQKERERICRSLLEGKKRYVDYFVFHVLKVWAHKHKIHDQREKIQGLGKDCEDIARQTNSELQQFESQKAELQDHIDGKEDHTDVNDKRYQTLIGMIMLKGDENHYMSKLRATFLAWRDHTKRTIAFCKTLKHVIQNTLWHQGFQNIKEFARDKLLTRLQNAHLARMRRMFWKRNCGAAFSRWKEKEFETACQAIEWTHNEIAKSEDAYKHQESKVKSVNGEKYTKYWHFVDKHKVWQAWKGVTKLIKAHRIAKKTTLESFGGYLQVRALRKWVNRVKATQFARDRLAKFRAFTHQLYLRACFREFKSMYTHAKTFALKLANMARKFDNVALQSGFQMIQNFKLAKDQVYQQRKKVAATDAISIIHKLYISRMTRYMSELRTRNQAAKESSTKRLVMIRHMLNRQLRRAWYKWKHQTEALRTVEDVNECGPVVEEVLEARLDIKNCVEFLRSEGYTEKQIDQFTELAETRSLDKLRKAVRHWIAHVNRVPDDNRLLPIVMNRWRFYTKMRKIIKHWLDFITVRNEPMRAALKRFFDKWKFHFNGKDSNLNQQSRAYLLKRCVESQRSLNKVTEEEVQSEDLVTHLSQQNDELYDNYIKSTRLAFALSRDNLEHAKRKAFGNLLENNNRKAIQKFEDVLGANIDLISGLKNKITEIERDNELLANENEELRQFTLDGYQIAKSVQSLEQEREKLSVDLADKAATIKKLLDENERLSSRLRLLQEQVVRTADEMQQFSQANRLAENSTRRQAYRQF